jgi:adenylate kinase
MDLVLFGIQGSGKGTQAKRLAAEFDYKIFEAGQALRDMAAGNTPLGQEVASYIDKGNLVPFNIIINVVESIVHATPAHQKILFDGIPRDLDQMKEFDRIMRECGREFRCVQLSLAKETAIERLQKRAQAEGRLDDMHIEYIERRIGIFMEKTMRVVEAYRAAGNMTVVNGLGTTDEVFGRLAAVVGDATLVA